MSDEQADEIAQLQGKVEFLGGQVHMLVSFLIAAIDAHPDPDGLSKRFELSSQVALAKTENVLLAEDYIDGELNIAGRLRTILKIARERKALRSKGQG
jgi:hypothetical protein